MESITIGQALSGLSMSLFTAVTVILLVAFSLLAVMAISLAFLKSAQLLLKAIREAAVAPAREKIAPARKLAKEVAK